MIEYGALTIQCINILGSKGICEWHVLEKKLEMHEMHCTHMEIRLLLSNATSSHFSASNVAPVERPGPQHERWCCSTTDLGVNEELSSCVP